MNTQVNNNSTDTTNLNPHDEITYDLSTFLRPHTPKKLSYENVYESDKCVFCDHDVVMTDKLIPIKKYKIMTYACYCCYNILNLGLSPNLFIIAISKISQLDIVKKTHEIIKTKRRLVPPHISLIDPDAIFVPLSDIEYAYVFKHIIKNKSKSETINKNNSTSNTKITNKSDDNQKKKNKTKKVKSNFLKMKLFFNAEEFNYSTYCGEKTTVQRYMRKNVFSGLNTYTFTKDELYYLDRCFYSNLDNACSSFDELEESIDHLTFLNNDIDNVIVNTNDMICKLTIKE